MLVESISIILGCFWARIRPIVWDKVPNWDMFCSPTFMNQVTIHYSYTKYCSPHLTNQNMFKKFCQFDWSNNSKIIRIRFFSPNNHESVIYLLEWKRILFTVRIQQRIVNFHYVIDLDEKIRHLKLVWQVEFWYFVVLIIEDVVVVFHQFSHLFRTIILPLCIWNY